jgi:hypothetical protein
MDLVFVPFMARERFAQLVGITPDVLERWIRDGRVKTYSIGRRSLVDLRQWLSAGAPK